jgi:very-short-patch-repair endonuclease
MTAERICDNASAHRFQGVSLRRQTPVARYVADFVCHAATLIIEVEGGQRRNACRTAQARGIVGFNNLDVMKNTAGGPAAIAVALSGSPPPCLTLPRKQASAAGHAGREDVR